MYFFFKNIKTKILAQSSGFTLVELLVSLGLFAVVSILGVSAVLVVIAANRTTLSTNSVLSNLDLVVEDMSRNLRVGSEYHCGDYTAGNPANTSILQSLKDCSPAMSGTGADNVSFLPDVSTDPDRTTYFKSGTSIMKAVNGYTEGAITAPEANITSLTFYVIGSAQQNASTNRTQPMIIMVIKGFVMNGSVPTYFNVETTISQRLVF